jgi:hypothetical protein
MESDTRARAVRTGGWMAVGGAAAILTGDTPIGIAIVAGVAGALAWMNETRTSRFGSSRN